MILWKFFIKQLTINQIAGDPSHPEEGVLRLRLPLGQDPQVRVVREGQEEEDHRHRQDEAPRPRPQVGYFYSF